MSGDDQSSFDLSGLPTSQIYLERNFNSLKLPLWTKNKAKLIQEYIKLFTYVTKHGVYIDGFAAPQRRKHIDFCSAKLVLEAEPKRVRDFWLCDKDDRGFALLKEIKNAHDAKGRRIHLIHGDFNEKIDDILLSSRITERTATFALLDQRMFECSWSTVTKIAAHKHETKIELFYFLAAGWFDRSIAAIKTPAGKATVERWWGRPDWHDLLNYHSLDRAYKVSDRFKSELGYRFVHPYPIYDALRGGRTMYYMIHATDHPEASPLMQRAYRKVSGRKEMSSVNDQIDFKEIW